MPESGSTGDHEAVAPASLLNSELPANSSIALDSFQSPVVEKPESSLSTVTSTRSNRIASALTPLAAVPEPVKVTEAGVAESNSKRSNSTHWPEFTFWSTRIVCVPLAFVTANRAAASRSKNLPSLFSPLHQTYTQYRPVSGNPTIQVAVSPASLLNTELPANSSTVFDSVQLPAVVKPMYWLSNTTVTAI